MINKRRLAQSFLPKNQPLMPWNRFNNLVDGIFGFSATVLMLRLATPIYEEGQLDAALREQGKYYLLYGLGFLIIVSTWSILRRMSSWTLGIDYYGMLLATISLMMWATLPFTLDILADALDNRDDVVAITRLMSLTLLVGMIAYTGLFIRLERMGLYRDGLDPDVFQFGRLVVYTVSVWPVASYLLTYVNVVAALACYFTTSLLALIPLDAMTSEMYAEERVPRVSAQIPEAHSSAAQRATQPGGIGPPSVALLFSSANPAV